MRRGNGQAEAVAALPDDYLECRYPNHWWNRKGVYPVKVERRHLVAVEFVCRCGAKRRDMLTSAGERVSSSIKYPDGYVIKGHGRIKRIVSREETIGRFMTKASK